MSVRARQAAADQVRREGVLADRIRASRGRFDAESLSRSYNLPVDRVRTIIRNNGGLCA